jgi:hypothetical protein
LHCAFSHPRVPAADSLDLLMKGRSPGLEDFLEYMVPPAPFAPLVAEAVDDCMSSAEWCALTGLDADDRIRDAMVRMYAESVWPKFVSRYGWTPPQAIDEADSRRLVRFL